jgi:hypothetical protein
MATETERQTALGDVAARQLANATKTPPQMSRITPRWLTHLLQWTPVEAGIYRLNRVKDEEAVTVVWRQLLLLISDNYFSPSATTTTCCCSAIMSH